MGTWSRNSAGRWTHFGTGRAALIAERAFPSDSAFKLQMTPPSLAHGVFALVLASKDGRSAYEIGLVGANIVIRSVVFADPASVTNWDSAAHGLTAGQPWTLEVRFNNGAIEARLNGSTTAIVSHTPGDSSSPTFAGYKHFGFVSNVDGAQVLGAQLCDLIPQRVNRADLLAAACGGDGFMVEGQTVRLLRAGMFNATGDVAMVEFEQKVYCVDGAHAWIIDPILLTVEKWIPTAGALPGQTEDGTTTATIIAVYRGRLWLAGMPEDPQNLFASAVNSPLNWDTGSNEYGGAFGLTPANIGKIGQPITCLARSTRNSLVIGCNASIWELVGDPATGQPELSEILNKHGISGKDAYTSLAEGRLMVHTTGGAYLLPALGEPIPLSAPILSEGIDIPREDIDDYIVQVRRDPHRAEVYFFLTKRTADGISTHLAYEENVGGYAPQNGGWEPDDFAERFGPTASTPEPYLGHIVWGTRDGYLMILDDDLNEDDGETVTVRTMMNLLDEPKVRRETILHSFAVLPADGTVVKYRVYGALTPGKVFGYTAGRATLLSGTIDARRQGVCRKVRAPALVIELYNDADSDFGIEEGDCVTTAGRIVTQRDLSAAAAPGAPCTPLGYPVSSSEASSDEFSSGPGFTTGFSTDEGTSESLVLGTNPTEPSISSFPLGFTSGTELSETLVTDPLGTTMSISPNSNPHTAVVVEQD